MCLQAALLHFRFSLCEAETVIVESPSSHLSAICIQVHYLGNKRSYLSFAFIRLTLVNTYHHIAFIFHAALLNKTSFGAFMAGNRHIICNWTSVSIAHSLNFNRKLSLVLVKTKYLDVV